VGGLVISPLGRLLVVHGYSFIAQSNKDFFGLDISCESFNPFPFTSKDMNNIFTHELIPYQQ
jgi:hypothetical protein